MRELVHPVPYALRQGSPQDTASVSFTFNGARQALVIRGRAQAFSQEVRHHEIRDLQTGNHGSPSCRFVSNRSRTRGRRQLPNGRGVLRCSDPDFGCIVRQCQHDHCSGLTVLPAFYNLRRANSVEDGPPSAIRPRASAPIMYRRHGDSGSDGPQV